MKISQHLIKKETSRWLLTGLFGLSLLIFTLGLRSQEVVGFEARFYLFVQEAYQYGLGLFPTSYQLPYPDYPIFPTLLIYGLSHALGHLTKLTAVLPTAMAAALTVVYTYRIGALHSRQWGITAVLFLFLTHTFVMEARTLSPDQYVVLVTTMSFYYVYADLLNHKATAVWVLGLLFGIGFASRGPIGVVIPAGVVCFTYLMDRRFCLFLKAGVIATIVLVLGCAMLFAAAYHVGGTSFMADVWRMQVAGRLQDAYLPFSFYFTESIGAYALTFPLMICMLLGCGLWIVRKSGSVEARFLQKCLVWILVIMVGLSVPAGKKIRYILAISPALALFCAYLWVAPSLNSYMKTVRNSLVALFYAVPLILLCIMSLAKLTGLTLVFLQWDFATWQIVLIGLQSINMLALYFSFERVKLVVLAVTACVFLIVYIQVVESINLASNRTHSFVSQIEAFRVAHHAELIFYRENPDGLPIKYFVNQSTLSPVRFIEQLSELPIAKKSYCLVLTEEHLHALAPTSVPVFSKVMTGHIGHESAVGLCHSINE